MATAFRARTSWSAGAKRAFREVTEDHPALEKSTLTSLYAACDLIDAADSMQAQIDADGLMVKGSMGQDVAHPLISEVRQYRKAAMDAIKALGLGGRSSATAAGSALAQKRWSSRPCDSWNHNLPLLPDIDRAEFIATIVARSGTQQDAIAILDAAPGPRRYRARNQLDRLAPVDTAAHSAQPRNVPAPF